MNVSAVGFLFQDRVKSNGFYGNNYTCIIHKMNKDGNFNRNYITSPFIKETKTQVVSPEAAQADVLLSLNSITEKKKKGTKFIGATVKDGIKETEIHSLWSDKLFAVRTKDERGKNHFRILGRSKTQRVLSGNLNLNA